MTRTHRRSHRGARRTQTIPETISPRLFKALCDPNRIALLERLAECRRPCGVTELSGCCAVDLSVVSRHLATLREAGVLTSTRRGKETYYEVRASELVRTLRSIADAIETCCGTTQPRSTRSTRGDHPPRTGKERR